MAATDRLRHPLERVPIAIRGRVFALLVLANALPIFGIRLVDGPLRTETTPVGIVSYEFCAFDDTCARTVEAYGRGARLEAGFSLGVDYLFMVTYAIGLGAAVIFVARGPRRRAIAAWLAWGVVVAALCDAVENVALLAMLLGDHATPALGWISGIFASVKMGLLAIAILALPFLRFGGRDEA